MKIDALTLSQQLKQQLLQRADIYMLETALNNLYRERDQAAANLDTDTQVRDEIQSIVGKTEDEIAQMCKGDKFLEYLVEDILSEPYTEDLERYTKCVEAEQKRLDTVNGNLVKIYDLLNPSIEFLITILQDFIAEFSKDLNIEYNPFATDEYPADRAVYMHEVARLERFRSLLGKLKQPQFSGFTDAEKIKLLLGPIKDFLPWTDFISEKDIATINDKYHLNSGNLTTLLCESQKTLFVPPHLNRFAFAPVKDEYDRVLLRLTAFTDAIVAARDYLTKSNAKKPFQEIEQLGLTNLDNVVNWWRDKTWPYVRKKLIEKKRPLTEIMPIVQNMAQNFLILPDCWKCDYSEEYFTYLAWEKRGSPTTELTAKEYQTAFHDLIRHLPHCWLHNKGNISMAQNVLERIPNSFTPEKFDKTTDDTDFFDWVFMDLYLGAQDIDKETIYGIAGGLDFEHKYFHPHRMPFNPQDFDKNLSALAQKYELMKPSEQLLEFAAKFAKER